MRTVLIVVMCMITSMSVCGQDSLSLYDKAFNLPGKLFGAIHRKSDKFQQGVLKSTAKYINKLERQEMKMKRKLAKTDSTKAEEVFGDIRVRYDSLLKKSANYNNDLAYSSHVDSMKTSILFIQRNGGFPGQPSQKAKIQNSLQAYSAVQSRFNQTQFIENQLKARQQFLRQKLENAGLANEFKIYQQKIYYYRAQMTEYKTMFEQPGLMEKKLLKLVTKVPSFNKFFNKYSMLASLFRLPGNEEDIAQGSAGLQTRSMITQELQQRLGTGPNIQQMMNANMQNAQSQLDKLKQKINKVGSIGADMNMPEFTPQTQKTKSFFKRLEYGMNVQSTKSNSWFPVTSDIGVSLGYKMTERSILGIGTGYKLGWGRDIRNMSFTHEGASIRTFLDWKWKKSFWLSAGAEMNYLSRIKEFEELKNYRRWKKSALAGISKKYRIKKQAGEIKLLYNFLWNRQIPAEQPIIFRTGYTF